MIASFVRSAPGFFLGLSLLVLAPRAWSMDLGKCADPGQKSADGSVVSYAGRSELTLMSLNDSVVVTIAHKFDYEVLPTIVSSMVRGVQFVVKPAGEGYELDLGAGKSLIISTRQDGQAWFEVLAEAAGHVSAIEGSGNCTFTPDGLSVLKARSRR